MCNFYIVANGEVNFLKRTQDICRRTQMERCHLLRALDPTNANGSTPHKKIEKLYEEFTWLSTKLPMSMSERQKIPLRRCERVRSHSLLSTS